MRKLKKIYLVYEYKYPNISVSNLFNLLCSEAATGGAL